MDKKKSPSLFQNLISNEDYTKRLSQAASEVASILSAHCGPFATNAVIPTSIATMGMAEQIDRYTKDGISIISALRSEDPFTNYVSRLVTHVGEQVDRACHDGTTTSMLFFSSLITHLPDTTNYPKNKALGVRYSKYLKEILLELKDYITTQTLTVDSLTTLLSKKRKKKVRREDVRYALAYHEALISSKGDVELSDGVARVISSLPEEMFGYYEIVQTPVETDDQFVVTTRDYDIGFSSNVPKKYYNTSLSTELYYDKADVLVSDQDLVHRAPITNVIIAMMLSDKVFYSLLEEKGLVGPIEGDPDYDPTSYGLIQCPLDSTKPLIVISPTTSSCPLFDKYREMWNAHYPKAPIIDITMQPDALIRQSYAYGMCAMAGKQPINLTLYSDPASSIMRDIRVSHAGHYLRLSGLYHKTGDMFHPYYTDKTLYPFYTETLDEIKKNIDTDATNHVRKFTDSQVKSLVALYRAMTCQQIIDLHIGGTTHETIANRDVVNDTYGAALSAVGDGVVLCGYPKLFRFLDRQERKCGNAYKQRIYRTVISAIEDVIESIYGLEDLTVDALLDPYPTEVPLTAYAIPVYYNGVYVPKWFDLLDEMSRFFFPAKVRNLEDAERMEKLESWDKPILFQPVVGYHEQFTRYRAILPALLNSNSLIHRDI